MGVLTEIKEMKRQGMENDQISQNLANKGYSPREINDAFSQDQIKSAVDSENNKYEMPHTQNTQSQGSFYTPKTQEESDQNYMQPPAPNQNYSQDQNYYDYDQNYNQGTEQNYDQNYGYSEGYDQSGGYSNTDTIIEVAEQVFSEKSKNMEKKMDSLSEFANLAQTRIENNNERIKRIESIMDKMQIAILEKIGNYGKNIEGIKKEMEMMQDSFSKVLPELAKKHKSKSDSKK